MKRLLRRIPGLAATYRHARFLARVAYERRWADLQLMNDASHLRGDWDFSAPVEQERYARVLAAVAERRGPAGWGHVLEVGCAEGLFTLELARRASSVTAIDVSRVACARCPTPRATPSRARFAARCNARPHHGAARPCVCYGRPGVCSRTGSPAKGHHQAVGRPPPRRPARCE